MQIIFILVEPAVSENIGASARALKTMGFTELRLVNPCEHLNTDARKLAHGSNDILQNARLFDTLDLAIKDCDLIIGTSAKHRRVRNDYYPVTSIQKIISKKGNTIKQTAVVFGREESGLNNNELQLCDIVSYIPMEITYPSLNLAQAVMLFAWELSKLKLSDFDSSDLRNENSFKNLKNKVELYLKEIGVDKNEVLYNRIIERVNFLGEDDIHLLHSVLKYIND